MGIVFVIVLHVHLYILVPCLLKCNVEASLPHSSVQTFDLFMSLFSFLHGLVVMR